MTRVNARELDAIRKLYPAIQIKRTRHNNFIIGARGEELEAYEKVARGQLSNRQKKDLYWYERRRRQAKNQNRQN